MPPKKVEKKEIIPIFDHLESQLWWEYSEYQEEERKKIDEFFTTYALELKDFVTGNVKQTVKNISLKMGVLTHPEFVQEQLEKQDQEKGKLDPFKQPIMNMSINNAEAQEKSAQPQQQQQQNDQQQQLSQEGTQQILENMSNYLILQNSRYDYATFKMLLFFFQSSQEMNVMKFANNKLSLTVSRLLFELIEKKELKLQKFFFDWNPFLPDLALELYPKLALSQIEFLTLRSNQIDCNIIKCLCEAIQQNPECQIKHLELYDNIIGEQGIEAIGNLLNEYMKLEYLSLANNKIPTFVLLKPITQNIGYTVMNEEEAQKYREEEKERDDMIALKNKKKKVDEARLAQLMKLLPLKELGEEGSGVFGVLKNPQLKIFNIAMNPFPESDNQMVQDFISVLPDQFSLILIHNKFEQKTKDKIRSKYKKNIIL